MVNRLLLRLALHHILWVDIQQNPLFFHTDSGIYKSCMSFRQLCERLEVLDCYKGCLVNLDRVVEIERCDFRLNNGDPVQIRKRGSRQVKECYLQYRCRRESMP